ncbi:unnamed protein product [Ranitomeya imitator]|uniref:Uncharacterized protein n=1 Tax=Ranitomeya imitator TaxID=111125 RepID=A0ABN9MAP9_9NEOB|nr:unnamed protein product [Ranitomeya imitator]
MSLPAERRHSLGSLEECHSLIPFSLSCLRKENHPSVLRLALCPPGDVRSSVHSEGSPTGRYLDKDRVQGLNEAEHQVTADSAFKVRVGSNHRGEEMSGETVQTSFHLFQSPEKSIF